MPTGEKPRLLALKSAGEKAMPPGRITAALALEELRKVAATRTERRQYGTWTGLCCIGAVSTLSQVPFASDIHNENEQSGWLRRACMILLPSCHPAVCLTSYEASITRCDRSRSNPLRLNLLFCSPVGPHLSDGSRASVQLLLADCMAAAHAIVHVGSLQAGRTTCGRRRKRR